MPMPSAMKRSRAVELDAESAVELDGEQGWQEKGPRFELDGGLGSIKKVVDVVVVRSERIAGASDEQVAGKWPGGVTSKQDTTKTARVRRDLPPLPTSQGPACREREMKDCEMERRNWTRHCSVNPDGSYNYT